METKVKEDISGYASEAQREVLIKICGVNSVSENFFITGGTALSVFYLYHRTSEDLDLFSRKYQDLPGIDTELKRIFRKDLSIIQSSPEFFSYLIKDVKVDLVYDPLSIDGPRPIINLKGGRNLSIDTLDNITSNKLSAMASRSEPKDIIDFYFINKIVWKERNEVLFKECYEHAKQKEALLDDPAMTAYQIEDLLKRVLQEKEECIPSVREKMDWHSFEEDLLYYLELIYKMMEWR